MAKTRLARQVVLLAIAASFGAHAIAGFSISVKPLAKPVPAAAPAIKEAVTYPVAPPAIAPAAPQVTLKVAAGERLEVAIKKFLGTYGWTPAWLAGDVVAGDAMTFDGKDHEEALKAFLVHYKLIGERFSEEKGYVIRRGTDAAGAN